MNTRLCKIKLTVKDYETKESGEFSYVGEVVYLDDKIKEYSFRFFNTDSGTLAVTINFEKDIVKVIERNDNVDMVMDLKNGTYQKCSYRFDSNNVLNLETMSWDIQITDSYVELEYDLYAFNDPNHEHPMTKNNVRIEYEGEGKLC